MSFDVQKFGNALSGMGAGFGGRGGDWRQEQMLKQQQQQEQELLQQATKKAADEKRQKAMLADNRLAMQYLKAGKIDMFEMLATNRINEIERLGGNPVDTKQILLTAKDDPKKALALMESLDAKGVSFGLIEKPEEAMYLKDTQITENGQVITNQGGQMVAVDVPGYKRDTGDEKDRALRERQLTLEQERLNHSKNKPTATIQKEMLRIQDAVISSQENVAKFERLATDFEQLITDGGIEVTFNEKLKELLGSQDAVTDLRTEFTSVRLGQGLKLLPPGPATDKDVEMVMKGVPPANAPASQVASFLRGAAKVERFRSAYNQYKADYIGKTNSTKGINRNWRKKFESPVIKGRKFTLGEIYVTAQNNGVTPEKVAADFGVTLP